MRRPCFAEEDVGLASLADEEAGFSGAHLHQNPPFFSKSRRVSSFRSLSSFSSSSSSSPRSARLLFEETHQPHFLEACFLCKKPLGNNRDIFMYKGDTPFCSEECRQEQIEIDEAKENNWNLSSSMKARRKEQQSKSTPKKSQNYPVRTSTIAAA